MDERLQPCLASPANAVIASRGGVRDKMRLTFPLSWNTVFSNIRGIGFIDIIAEKIHWAIK
jgi:hypothetical protein